MNRAFRQETITRLISTFGVGKDKLEKHRGNVRLQHLLLQPHQKLKIKSI